SITHRTTTAADLGRSIERLNPPCVVLMDNRTVRLYREYQSSHRGREKLPSALVLMSSFIEELTTQLKNTSGIAYEVPGVTTFVALRSIITRPVTRVGVIHRPLSLPFVQRQKDLAAREKITMVPVQVGADPTAAEIQSALRSLRESGRID